MYEYKVTFFNNPSNVLEFYSLPDLTAEVERILSPITNRAIILDGKIFIDDDLKMMVGKYTVHCQNVYNLLIANNVTAVKFIYSADMVINGETGKCVKQRHINPDNYTFALAKEKYFYNETYKYYFKHVNDELDVSAFNVADVVFEKVNDTIYIIKDTHSLFKEYKVVAKTA